jgi:acetate kinase
MDARSFDRMVNHQSGLLGTSGTSADVRDLLAAEATDARAAEALALFCYRIRQTIGALAATLNGLEVLVFSGGIGEKSAEIRKRICSGLGFLGIDIDSALNQSAAAVISSSTSRVSVRVIQTDEEAVIATAVAATLQHKDKLS